MSVYLLVWTTEYNKRNYRDKGMQLPTKLILKKAIMKGKKLIPKGRHVTSKYIHSGNRRQAV